MKWLRGVCVSCVVCVVFFARACVWRGARALVVNEERQDEVAAGGCCVSCVVCVLCVAAGRGLCVVYLVWWSGGRACRRPRRRCLLRPLPQRARSCPPHGSPPGARPRLAARPHAQPLPQQTYRWQHTAAPCRSAHAAAPPTATPTHLGCSHVSRVAERNVSLRRLRRGRLGSACGGGGGGGGGRVGGGAGGAGASPRRRPAAGRPPPLPPGCARRPLLWRARPPMGGAAEARGARRRRGRGARLGDGAGARRRGGARAHQRRDDRRALRDAGLAAPPGAPGTVAQAGRLHLHGARHGRPAGAGHSRGAGPRQLHCAAAGSAAVQTI